MMNGEGEKAREAYRNQTTKVRSLRLNQKLHAFIQHPFAERLFKAVVLKVFSLRTPFHS